MSKCIRIDMIDSIDTVLTWDALSSSSLLWIFHFQEDKCSILSPNLFLSSHSTKIKEETVLYVTSYTQPSNSHKIAYFLVCTHLRKVWDTSMIWNDFMNPVIAEDSGSSNESLIFDLLIQICPIKGFMRQRLNFLLGKYMAKILSVPLESG